MVGPLVSVVVIFLDEERFLGEALASVFAQSYPRWELLLVDDGSSDGSARVARRWASRRPGSVRLLGHPGGANRGMSASRNLGLREAAGEYVAFLDADDAWEPGKLEGQVAALGGRPGAGMVYGRTLYWHGWTGRAEDAALDRTPDLGVAAGELVEPPRLLTLLYPFGEGATPSSSNFMLRREVAERVGGYEEEFRGMYEDQVFMTKIYLNEPIFVADGRCWDRYRQHANSCFAVAQKTGHDHSARLAYFDWLRCYLVDQGIEDPLVWRLLEEKRVFTRFRLHLKNRDWAGVLEGAILLLRKHRMELYRRLRAELRNRLSASVFVKFSRAIRPSTQGRTGP